VTSTRERVKFAIIRGVIDWQQINGA
jgi:hypothetical protein